MTKGNDTYFFVKNLQGDVTKIIDEDGTTVATYAYDAWGALLAENEDSSIEGFNPFRYRGYVYDTETELYYLQSRYYDPKTGRFINADDSAYTDTYSGSPLSTNMFAYCENNGVNGYDPSGNWRKSYHYSITYNKGKWFTDPTILKWVKEADDYPCGSTKYYSAPFHSRSNSLEIAKKLFNEALNTKNEKENTYFYFGKISDKEKQKQKTDKHNPKSRFINIDYLKYNAKKDKYKNNTKKAQQSFLNILNSYKCNKQYKMLLGLCLHTIQDHFAHRMYVYYATSKKQLKKRINSISWTPVTATFFSNNIIHNTDIFEDEPKVIEWRRKKAKKITKLIYKNFYSKNPRFISEFEEVCDTDDLFKHIESHFLINQWYYFTAELHYIDIIFV